MLFNLSLLVSIIETCNVVATFVSVDEILRGGISNETSSALLLHGAIWQLREINQTLAFKTVSGTCGSIPRMVSGALFGCFPLHRYSCNFCNFTIFL